jgi:hypothetical protein
MNKPPPVGLSCVLTRTERVVTSGFLSVVGSTVCLQQDSEARKGKVVGELADLEMVPKVKVLPLERSVDFFFDRRLGALGLVGTLLSTTVTDEQRFVVDELALPGSEGPKRFSGKVTLVPGTILRKFTLLSAKTHVVKNRSTITDALQPKLRLRESSEDCSNHLVPYSNHALP